jgi:SAM-dependent methyltransferase
MIERPHLAIVEHYEDCLRRHGAGARAVDWKSTADAALRYEVMLGVVRDRTERATLLDFGCGLADLKRHIDSTGRTAISYTGLEISPKFAAAARAANPATEILCLDVLDDPVGIESFDYIVMNGVFTRRHSLSMAAMQTYLERLLPIVFSKCRRGLAFNVMSTSVDWESEELYHAEPGTLITFIARELTRHFVLRNDYGLHETTIYLYREAIGKPREQAEKVE